MALKAALPFLSCLFVNLANAGLDFTPQTREYVEEGVTYRELTFKSAEGSVIYQPPQDWIARGQSTRLQLTPPSKNFAEAVIEVIPLPIPRRLDEAAITAFKQKMVATLPGGSQAITTVLEAENTIMPGGNPSFELTISYQLWGKMFHRSAILVNSPQDCLVFQLTSPREDFGFLNLSFRRSIMSWRFVESKQAQSSAVAATAANQPSAN